MNTPHSPLGTLQPALATSAGCSAFGTAIAVPRHNVRAAGGGRRTAGRVEDTAVTGPNADARAADANTREDEALRALMTGYQAGDREAFESLHAQLAPVLRRQLLRLARDPARVDDLLQETFLQLHRARHTYDPAFPVRPWAYAIARHVFLMDCRYRSRRGDLACQQPLDEAVADCSPGHEQALIARSRLGHALSRLSRSSRQSVLLHHLHGLSFQDIARRLHTGGPALRARASRGIARLREALEDDEHEQER